MDGSNPAYHEASSSRSNQQHSVPEGAPPTQPTMLIKVIKHRLLVQRLKVDRRPNNNDEPAGDAREMLSLLCHCSTKCVILVPIADQKKKKTQQVSYSRAVRTYASCKLSHTNCAFASATRRPVHNAKRVGSISQYVYGTERCQTYMFRCLLSMYIFRDPMSTELGSIKSSGPAVS